MSLAADIMLGIIVALLALIGAFMRYERTEAWRHGQMRKRALAMFTLIAPYFGASVKPPLPELPAVTRPYDDERN